MEALRHITAHFTQLRPLFTRFHTFGQYDHAQAAPHADDGRGNRPVVRIGFEVIDEGTVDLQLADRETFQVSQ